VLSPPTTELTEPAAPSAAAPEATTTPTPARSGARPSAIPAGGSPGRQLPGEVRAAFESSLGEDLGDVRVHTDGAAASSSDAVGAKAYTTGSDIVFAPGRFKPETPAGRELLAHELVHVVQGRHAAAAPVRTLSERGDPAEAEADALAPRLASSRSAQPVRATPAARIQRVTDDKTPAATIPADRGDVERGYYGTTDKVMYGVRASGPAKPEGLWMDHLFDTQAEAEAYAQDLAAKGAPAIRDQSALPYAWPAKTPGGMPVPGNPVTKVYVVEVPKDTPYIQGVVREQAENRPAPWLAGKTWGGGGPQTVIAWDVKTKAVKEFDVTTPAPSDPGAVPPPPDWITKPPTAPVVPPAAVATDDPRAVGRLYSPKLIQEYRSQEILYRFSSTQLDNLEAKEAKLKALGGDLSEQDKQTKATLAAQVAAAQGRMLQARKDYDLLDSPAATPQQLQELLARRGIGVPATPQVEHSGAPALQGSGISGWGLSDKGLTKQSGTATTRTVIGPDGKPVAITDEDSASTNIGAGSIKRVAGTKVTTVDADKTSVVDENKTKSVDVLKGEGSISRERNTEVTDDAGTKTKTADKTTYTAGVGGIVRAKEDSTQVGDKLAGTSSNFGIAREPGQLGITAGQGSRSGTMIGPPGQEKLDRGVERSDKITGGLVSDDKGTGLGVGASQDRKTLFGDGKSAGTTVAGGGRCQALVKEIPGSEPPRFTITTTISFDLKLGASAGKELEAKPGEQKDTGLKGNVTIGAGASVGMYASFKHELNEAQAKEYIEFVKQNGRGSSLPEHRILATGASEGWEAAKRLWQALNGSPELLKTLKPGEEVDTNVEVGGEAKVGVGGGESGQGGLSLGGEGSVKGKHKIRVTSAGRADGKVVLTAAIEDEGEVAGALAASYGGVGGKGGISATKGMGRTIAFVLDPKDPAFASQVAAINGAVTPEDLDDFARHHHDLVDTTTEKDVTGEGTTAGLNVGPLAVDMFGKGKLTSEVTRDKDGNVIASKYTGENEGGGTVGVGPVKVGDSKAEKYVGEVDKAGKAKGELSETSRSTSVGKSILSAGGKITNDPLGTLLNPSKLVDEQVDQKGTAIADPQVMGICYAALDKSKWDWKVGGMRHDDWVAAGNKIRNACVVRGAGRDAEIVSVDKHAVQQALAEWTKSDVEGRKEVLDSIIRPLGGMPEGKAFAFPDGTENLKPEWDALVIADPLEGARATLADKKPKEALGEMQAVRGRVAHLYASVNSAPAKWAGLEIQRAEMLGHINNRGNEIDQAIRDLAKTMPAAAKPSVTGTGTTAAPAVTTVPTAEETKEQEGRARADEARADLVTYNNNIEVMKGYADSVFRKLGQAEARINDESFWSAGKNTRIIDAIPMVKEAEDLIKIWDALYWPTFKIYEKWSPMLALDKSRIEKLHTAGARGRLQQVYDLTRDKSMAGRT
jgi:hypothetical protein